MVFSIVVYKCESWAIKKAEHWRIDAFKLQCRRRLFRVTWTARKWNQSILKEINPEYSLEGLMLKLKLQYFGHLTSRADSLEKTLMLGKTEGKGEGGSRGWDGWMALPTQWTSVWASSGRQWTGEPGMLQCMQSQRAGHDLTNDQPQVWEAWAPWAERGVSLTPWSQGRPVQTLTKDLREKQKEDTAG